MSLPAQDGTAEEVALPFDGNGYQFQAQEVMACVARGALSSAVMPLEESVAIMDTMDALRRSWGLRYPMDRDV